MLQPNFEFQLENGSVISFKYLHERDEIVIKGQDQLTQKDYSLTVNKGLLAKIQPNYLPTVEDFFDILYSNFERKDWISPDFTISIEEQIVLSATKKKQHKFTFQLQEVRYTPEEKINRLAENIVRNRREQTIKIGQQWSSIAQLDSIMKRISKVKDKERLWKRKVQRQIKALMVKAQVEEVPTDQDSQEDSDDQS